MVLEDVAPMGSVVWARTSTPLGMMAMFGIGSGAALMIVAQRALWTCTAVRS